METSKIKLFADGLQTELKVVRVTGRYDIESQLWAASGDSEVSATGTMNSVVATGDHTAVANPQPDDTTHSDGSDADC